MNRSPLIQNVLQVGISSLKTVFCVKNKRMKATSDSSLGAEKEESKSELESLISQGRVKHLEQQCPVCDPVMNQISSNLKFAQQIQTSMKCSVSGKIMDHLDPPLWVPLKNNDKKTDGQSKMSNGYLLAKSMFDSLSEHQVSRK